jgi:hypothetical protein
MRDPEFLVIKSNQIGPTLLGMIENTVLVPLTFDEYIKKSKIYFNRESNPQLNLAFRTVL